MIPEWLRQRLANPPVAGTGVNPWLFSTARQLHAHMGAADMAACLRDATLHCGRRVTELEITRAVRNSEASAWTRGGAGEVRSRNALPKGVAGAGVSAPAPDYVRWPEVMFPERRAMISWAAERGVRGVADLWERSPRRVLGAMTADDWLDWLFPGAEWLCLAADHPGTARSRTPHKWSFGPADGCGLVVPSPMTGPSGNSLDGKPSHRCLGNTGLRRWLVIEFDSGTLDEQAALHWSLDEGAEVLGWPRLAMVVMSGGKSVHGWYGICGDEQVSREMMEYAATLGADVATWNRCQLVRLPAGLRRKTTEQERDSVSLPDGWPVQQEIRQSVVYWDPLAPANDTTLCKPLGNNHFTSRQERLASTFQQASAS